MSLDTPKGSTGKALGKWGSQWGSQWGCGDQDFHDICKIHEWKQLEFATNFQILCQIFANLALSAEGSINAMQDGSGIDNAHGDELDQWGDMLNQRRFGATDDLFRRQIKGQARKLSASGSPDDFYDVADTIQPKAGITILEAFPACVRMYFRNLTVEEQRVLFGLMVDQEGVDGVPALTICMQFVDVDPDGVFEFSYLNDDSSLFPIDHHWSHTDGDIPSSVTAGMAFLV